MERGGENEPLSDDIAPGALDPPQPPRSSPGSLASGRKFRPGRSPFSVCCSIAVGFSLWWFVTRGEPEQRILPPSKGLPSPRETFASFPSLWFDRELTRNTLTTLRAA